jgi:hypothetical protein
MVYCSQALLHEDAGNVSSGIWQGTRFRDTFAVELHLAAVPLERVSILLGHTSVKITERHDSPRIRKRQEQAEADVRRTWIQDPIALLETKGTPEVHKTNEPVNGMKTKRKSWRRGWDTHPVAFVILSSFQRYA